MSMDVFEIPKSLVDKVNKVLHESSEEISEVSAPGQEAWIKANKERFEREYGAEKGKEVLYAKAWKMHKEETEHDQKKVAVSPRHENDSSVLLEKGKKKDEVDEEKTGEKIIFNPEVFPDRINSDNVDSNKTQRTV